MRSKKHLSEIFFQFCIIKNEIHTHIHTILLCFSQFSILSHKSLTVITDQSRYISILPSAYRDDLELYVTAMNRMVQPFFFTQEENENNPNDDREISANSTTTKSWKVTVHRHSIFPTSLLPIQELNDSCSRGVSDGCCSSIPPVLEWIPPRLSYNDNNSTSVENKVRIRIQGHVPTPSSSKQQQRPNTFLGRNVPPPSVAIEFEASRTTTTMRTIE